MGQEKLPSSFRPNEDVVPLPESFQPEMNFAVVNKKYVEPDSNSLATKAGAVWDKVNEPLVKLTPEMKSAMDSFSTDHPTIGGAGQFLTNALLSMSSPATLGLGALSGGSSLAEKFGLESLARALEVPGKAAAGGMVGHGLYKIGTGDTIADKVGGGLESGLGILGLRGGITPKIPESFNPESLPDINMGPEFAATDTPVMSSGARGKPIEQLQFELAQKKFNMGQPLPEFNSGRNNSNFIEGSGGLSDIAAGKVNIHPLPGQPTAKFIGWQPDGDGGHIPLYNIDGGPLHRSTVSVATLEKNGIPVPKTPEVPTNAPAVFVPAKDKLMAALENSKAATKEQKVLNAEERGRRIAQFGSHNISDEASFDSAMGELKGKFPKAEYDPIRLHQGDVDTLFKEMSQKLTGYEMPRGGIALKKLMNGEVLQPNEQALLKRAFGPQFADVMQKARPLKAQSLFTQAINIPKSMLTWLHFTAPFRQGSGLVLRKEFWTSLDDMFKSFGSEKFYQGVMESIREEPHFELGQEVGLSLTHLNEGLAQREESFMAPILDKMPLMKASARGYTGFLNKLRSDTFNSLVESAKAAGIDPNKDLNFARQIASYVNNATGRGSLGKFERVATELNNLFFSPRLMSAKMQMLNPNNYIQIGKGLAPQQAQFMRMQYLRSALGYAGFGALAVGIAKAGGGTVSPDRNSSDFGKLKIGDKVRLDPYGGMQQYVVALNQLQSGEKDTATGRHQIFGNYGMPTRMSNMIDFGANRLAPVPKFAYDILNASKSRPFDISEQTANLFTPMVISDIYELAKAEPDLLPLAGLDAMGIKTETYGKGIKKSNPLVDFSQQILGR